MSGFLYLLALIAVPWLVAWLLWDPARSGNLWWPFDMQGDPPPVPRPETWRGRRAGRDPGGIDADAAAAAARAGVPSQPALGRWGRPAPPTRSARHRHGSPSAGSQDS